MQWLCPSGSLYSLIALTFIAHRTHSAGEAEPRSWILLQDDEMKSTQIAGKIFCGDPPATSDESLESLTEKYST